MRAVSTYSLLSKRCLAECPASSAQYMSVIWRGKCCTKTVVLSVTVSSCPSATEMASNKLQGNLPFRWQKSLPTNAEVHGASRLPPEVSMPVFSTINLMPGSETHWLRWLTSQGVKLSIAALGLCLFCCLFPTFLPWHPVKPEREFLPPSFTSYRAWQRPHEVLSTHLSSSPPFGSFISPHQFYWQNFICSSYFTLDNLQ